MSTDTRQASVTERPAARFRALVVGDDDDTLLRLRDYLLRAGVQTRATRRLADAWTSSGEAIVLLPDDFAAGEVTDGLSRVLARPPVPFIIIVTAVAKLFEPLIQSLDGAQSVVIMPKPVWGWTIVDLLRSRKDTRG